MDIRKTAAAYYDLNPDFPDDIPFYLSLIPPEARVLELGCGTGRVTLPLAQRENFVQGIDISPAMVAICRERLANTGLTADRAVVEVGDITYFDLQQSFDAIIAPFRVLQNLETDEQVHGLFRCIRSHMVSGGACILNVFHPNRDPDGLREHWVRPQEVFQWELPIKGGRIACYVHNARLDPEKLVLYPELIYRRYQGDALVDEAVLKIVMRCYYPEEFAALVQTQGFVIHNRWGGYHGEPYGHGSELVLQFGAA